MLESIVFTGALLGIGVYVMSPVLMAAAYGWGEPEPAADPLAVQQLQQKRDAALFALRDLAADHELGKLDQADYDRLRAYYMREAARLLKELES